MATTPPPLLAPIPFLKNRLWTHTVFWLVVLAILITGSSGEWQTRNFWPLLLIAVMQLMVYCYLILFVLVPYLFYRSRFLAFIIASIGWAFCWSYLMYQMSAFLVRFEPQDAPQPTGAMDSFSVNMLFLFLVVAIKLGKDLLLAQYENEMAQRQKMQQELNFLRAQLSPHFLLNTMNNLYGLAHEKSDALPGLMLRLSDLLKYSIYDTRTDKVPLKDEVQYLLDYIELQKIRMNQGIQLDIHFPDKINPALKVAPLLLVVFVENAFKHSQGIYSKTAQHIRLHLHINRDILHFVAENSLPENIPDWMGKNVETKKEGIGLETTLRRIELLYGKESLPVIQHDEHCYRVSLDLKLAHEENKMFDR
jgi:sensor histidine kinase YesM